MGALASFLGSSAGSATVAGGSNLFGSLVGWAASAQQNAKQRKFQKEMADYAYDKDVEMWNMSNDYNTPANQMQRFTEAGLNPNLIYGQGNPGNTTTSPAKYQQVTGKFGLPEKFDTGIPQALSMYQDFQMKKAQTEAIKEQTNRTRQQTALLGLDIILKNADVGLKPAQVQHLLNKMMFTENMWPHQLNAAELSVEQKKAHIAQMIEQANLTSAQRKKLEYWQEQYEKFGITEHDPFWARIALRIAQGDFSTEDLLPPGSSGGIPEY